MNINLLIDAVVRQTTVLIAQLATSGGIRAPLAHTANRVFLDLVLELKQQGLGAKVISDMFGLTLRAYHAKIARLSESGTEPGKSLSEVVYEHVRTHGAASRLAILERFSADDERVLGAVLRDLVDTGLFSRSGRGDRAVYRVAEDEDAAVAGDPAERTANVVWTVVYQRGPLDAEQITEHLRVEASLVSNALERLTKDGRIQGRTTVDGRLTYTTDGCVIPLGSTSGWEAAVFDHYQAVVTALCTKLALGRSRAVPGEWIGGSTYSSQVWEGHPLHDEVLGFLQQTRTAASALRARVEAYNVSHEEPVDGVKKVVFYAGQTVVGAGETEGSEE